MLIVRVKWRPEVNVTHEFGYVVGLAVKREHISRSFSFVCNIFLYGSLFKLFP